MLLILSWSVITMHNWRKCWSSLMVSKPRCNYFSFTSINTPPLNSIHRTLWERFCEPQIKEYACNSGDLGAVPVSGRPPDWSGYPLQYSGILWTEEDGGLQSLGSQRVRHDGATKHSNTLTQPIPRWKECLLNTVLMGLINKYHEKLTDSTSVSKTNSQDVW